MLYQDVLDSAECWLIDNDEIAFIVRVECDSTGRITEDTFPDAEDAQHFIQDALAQGKQVTFYDEETMYYRRSDSTIEQLIRTLEES